MPKPPEYAVWEWYDPDTRQHYVGVGKFQKGKHPSVRCWEARSVGTSALDDWLCKWPFPPPLVGDLPSGPLSKQSAMAVRWSRIVQLRNSGANFFQSRPAGTWAGGGNRRVVISPQGRRFASVREAAKDYNVNPCTITRLCARGRGWRYDDEVKNETDI
jgi:hypothetical protein